MKNKLIIGLLASTIALSGCYKVPAGYVGVKVKLYGTDKGLEIEELPVGRYFNGIGTEYHKFPMFQQNATWEVPNNGSCQGAITFQDRQGLTIESDIGVKYHIQEGRAVELFEKYRKGIDEITEIDVKNIVRNSFNREASNYSIRDIYGVRKNEFIDNVYERVREQTEPYGIIVEEVYVVGSFCLPDQVYASISETQKAEQNAIQRQNEVESERAEAEKKRVQAQGEADASIARSKALAESTLLEAQAQAEANRILAESVTPTLIEYERVNKWDGRMPVVGGSDANLLLDVTGLTDE